jgi:hypothetical protein
MDAADHLDLVVTDLERSPAFHRGLLGPLGHVRESPIEAGSPSWRRAWPRSSAPAAPDAPPLHSRAAGP